MNSRHETLSGWGRYPSAETEVFRPERLPELDEALGAREHVIGRGLGRSYGDASFASDGGTVVSERLDRILALDVDGRVVDAEAGVSLDALLEVVVPRGLFPKVVPGTRFVTLGGMLACDVHGKNHHHDGTFSRHVLDFDLRLASGERVRVSRESDPDLFAATAGGMGLTGFVERVRMSLAPIPSAWISTDIDRTDDFEGALEKFHENDADYDFSVAWVDCTAKGRHLGRSVLLRGNWTEATDLKGARRIRPHERKDAFELGVPLTPPSGLLNPLTVRAFNTAYYRRHPKQARGVVTGLEPFFFPLDFVHDWNRLYGPRGFLQYQMVIPEDGGREGLRILLEKLSKAGAASFLSVLKRFGAAEAGALLSFPRPGYTLTLDLPWRGPATLELLDDLDRVVLEHGGRLYLAKDARMRAETFRAMYPELPRWLEVKRRVDPEGRFRSDLARRLEIVS